MTSGKRTLPVQEPEMLLRDLEREITDAAAALIRVKALEYFEAAEVYRGMREAAAERRANAVAVELDRAAHLLRAFPPAAFPSPGVKLEDARPTS